MAYDSHTTPLRSWDSLAVGIVIGLVTAGVMLTLVAAVAIAIA